MNVLYLCTMSIVEDWITNFNLQICSCLNFFYFNKDSLNNMSIVQYLSEQNVVGQFIKYFYLNCEKNNSVVAHKISIYNLMKIWRKKVLESENNNKY